MDKFSMEESNGVAVYVSEDIEYTDITVELNDAASDLPNRELKVIVT